MIQCSLALGTLALCKGTGFGKSSTWNHEVSRNRCFRKYCKLENYVKKSIFSKAAYEGPVILLKAHVLCKSFQDFSNIISHLFSR